MAITSNYKQTPTQCNSHEAHLIHYTLSVEVLVDFRTVISAIRLAIGKAHEITPREEQHIT